MESITDYADELALQVNIPEQAEFVLNSLEQAARAIGFYMKV